MRIGHGYDVHKFCKNRKLILGGVVIDYPLGLLGHSDADVLTHSIMDSLLGAACQGDIGKLFPDNDEKYKNANSLTLLKEVCSLLEEKKFKIINIDCTIIAEAPKLSKYTFKMRKNISEICNIELDEINIKATTEEGMGFTGSMQAIASHAVCLISKI